MGRGWFILGNAYKKIRIYEKAKEVYLEGLDHALENNDELRQVKLYHRLGLLYSALEDYEEARSYYQTIINYEGDTSRGYLRYVGKALHDMGSSYMYEGNYKEAVPYLRKALAIKNSDTEKFITYMDLGTSYVELGEHKEGIVYYQKAKECYNAVEPIKEHIELFRLMDLAYRKVDDHKIAVLLQICFMWP